MIYSISHTPQLRRLVRSMAVIAASAAASFAYTLPARALGACSNLAPGVIEAATGTSATGHFGAELGSATVPVSSTTTYCVDYTIHSDNGSNADIGYVEFAILVTKNSLINPNNSDPGNLTVVGLMPTVYYTPTGVLIPSGGTPTSFAQPFLITSSTLGPNLTADADDGMIKGNQTAFNFQFKDANGATITVSNFSASNNPSVTGVCTSTCDVASTFSTSVNFLDGNNDGTISSPIGFGDINPVPEIDGGRLPQIILLLSTLYLLVFRRSPHNLNAASA